MNLGNTTLLAEGMTRNGFAALSKSFCPKVLRELATTGHSRTLASILKESGISTSLDTKASIQSYFDTIYERMLIAYPNEYVFKNLIFEKLLLGRHSVKTSSILTEFRVGTSKADIVIVNGSSHIYEIKTELDNLERLNAQLSNYLSFAEYVTVACNEKHVDALLRATPPEVGIMMLTKRITFRAIRKPVSGLKTDRLDKSLIFDCLRREEYTSLLLEAFGSLPHYPNTKVHDAYKDIFKQLDIALISRKTNEVLRRRSSLVNKECMIQSIAPSLRFLTINNMLTNDLHDSLLKNLRHVKVSSLVPNSI